MLIGAGSSGSIVASKVADKTGLNVLVIEAGGSDFRPDIKTPIGYGLTFYNKKVNWCYETIQQEKLANRSVYCPRGKVVGGSGSINAMVYVRGQPGDYDHWQTRSSSDFGWGSVKSYFDALEGVGANDDVERISITNVEASHENVLENFFSAADSARSWARGVPLVIAPGEVVVLALEALGEANDCECEQQQPDDDDGVE